MLMRENGEPNILKINFKKISRYIIFLKQKQHNTIYVMYCVVSVSKAFCLNNHHAQFTVTQKSIRVILQG